ncbi:MAG: response regulator, partial [Thermoplasmatota archaeon]
RRPGHVRQNRLHSASAPGGGHGHRPHCTGKKDDPAIQELLDMYFTPLGVEIHRAHGGIEGVQLYRRLLSQGKQPDIVIMDIKLPAMNGIEATKKIKEIDHDAVIYGFTAFASAKGEELRRAGAQKVIPRTFGFPGLRDIVSSTFNARPPPA